MLDPKIRIQKYLAEKGIASRRRIEEWIAAGRIKINGTPAVLGAKVNDNDKIYIDNKHIQPKKHQASAQFIIYHKPTGEICTRFDPQERPTVFKNLPKLKGQKWNSIGRLDINTSGLMIFTTDGDLAHKLMHPSSEIVREYQVRILGLASAEQLDNLRKGVTLEDGTHAAFNSIVGPRVAGGANSWYSVTLSRGKYREVRRMFEAVGLVISRLIRNRYGAIELPKTLRPGKSQPLTAKQVQALLALLPQAHKSDGHC